MRSYREDWQRWGITTALQTLLMQEKNSYTLEDILNVARLYDVTEDLFKRLSYIPETAEEALHPENFA
tara:strand:- start:42 stop:245 length:204 start_codon:yes stop_codon:yes gene_type:complete